MNKNISKGTLFESLCCRLLTDLGFENCKPTSQSNDQGADISGDYNNTPYVFQCKNHKKPTGNRAVQEIVSAKAMYNAQRCGVISQSDYTKSARQAASSNYCLLLTSSELQEAVDRGKSFADLIQNYTFNDSTPVEHDYEVVKEYERVKSVLGHTPQRKNFDATWLYRIKKHYGSLSKLINSVGDRPYSRRPSDEDIEREYKRVRNIIGKTPTLEDISNRSSFSRNCFSAFPFTQLQRKCGDQPYVERGVSKEQLITAFEALKEKLGRIPTVKELDEKGKYRANYYRKRWGTMDNFREEMGIPKRSFGQRSYEREELLLLFMLLNKTLQIQKGDTNFQIGYMDLERMKFGERTLVSPDTFSRKFGKSWKACMQELSKSRCSEFSQALDRLVEEF
ncbi:MAG: restriction endonuclease [Gammaproteobacteria bacterium]|nr:restriction endonuclease [Gammaproteobacteria bacterium]